MGGSQAFVGGVARLKTSTHFGRLFLLQLVGEVRTDEQVVMGKFVAVWSWLQSLDTEVEENWENEGGKRWFPPRKNILNTDTKISTTIKSWCFGSVSPSSNKVKQKKEHMCSRPGWHSIIGRHTFLGTDISPPDALLKTFTFTKKLQYFYEGGIC